MVDNCLTGGRVCGNYYNDVSNGDFIRVCWSWGSRVYYRDTHFSIPYSIHVALATSLTAMAFTTLSGVISHYREGNVVLTIGGIVGDVERLVLISVQNWFTYTRTSSSLVYSWDAIFICNFYVY